MGILLISDNRAGYGHEYEIVMIFIFCDYFCERVVL